jgi:hypothetical protein
MVLRSGCRRTALERSWDGYLVYRWCTRRDRYTSRAPQHTPCAEWPGSPQRAPLLRAPRGTICAAHRGIVSERVLAIGRLAHALTTGETCPIL